MYPRPLSDVRSCARSLGVHPRCQNIGNDFGFIPIMLGSRVDPPTLGFQRSTVGLGISDLEPAG